MDGIPVEHPIQVMFCPWKFVSLACMTITTFEGLENEFLY